MSQNHTKSENRHCLFAEHMQLARVSQVEGNHSASTLPFRLPLYSFVPTVSALGLTSIIIYDWGHMALSAVVGALVHWNKKARSANMATTTD